MTNTDIITALRAKLKSISATFEYNSNQSSVCAFYNAVAGKVLIIIPALNAVVTALCMLKPPLSQNI